MRFPARKIFLDPVSKSEAFLRLTVWSGDRAAQGRPPIKADQSRQGAEEGSMAEMKNLTKHHGTGWSKRGARRGRGFGPGRGYPVAADVAYRLMWRGRAFREGLGRIVDISSSQVLMAIDDILPVDSTVELRIAWPAKLDDNVALSLHVKGRALTSVGNHAAVAIEGYEFRTRVGENEKPR
jgi:hypothetical protein